jgi:hypothetical protein
MKSPWFSAKKRRFDVDGRRQLLVSRDRERDWLSLLGHSTPLAAESARHTYIAVMANARRPAADIALKL